MTADKDVSARAVSDVECAVVAELVVRIRDRGPEPDWHTNRSLFGPWCRFEAELVGDAGVREQQAAGRSAPTSRPANKRVSAGATTKTTAGTTTRMTASVRSGSTRLVRPSDSTAVPSAIRGTRIRRYAAAAMSAGPV